MARMMKKVGKMGGGGALKGLLGGGMPAMPPSAGPGADAPRLPGLGLPGLGGGGLPPGFPGRRK